VEKDKDKSNNAIQDGVSSKRMIGVTFLLLDV